MAHPSWDLIRSEYLATKQLLVSLNPPESENTVQATSDKSDDYPYRHQSTMVFRNTDDQNLIKTALDSLPSLMNYLDEALQKRELGIDLVTNWGKFQLYSGVIIANLMGNGDDLAAVRGGKKSGGRVREDTQRTRALIHVLYQQLSNKELSYPSMAQLWASHFPDIEPDTLRKHIAVVVKKAGK